MQLTFWYRYVTLDIAGQRAATFPDLIVTLGTKGTPLAGEEVCKGQDVYVLVIPDKRVAAAADRARLFRHMESIIRKPFHELGRR